MKRLVIIDNGHGYDTKGKKAMMPNGLMFEEWEFTRMIKLRLISILHKNKHPFVDLVPESNDILLPERVRRADFIGEIHKAQRPYLISIHGDAFKSKKANGVTVFTSKGTTESDAIGDVFVDAFKKLGWNNRYDIDHKGKKGREADFFIIKKTKRPAVLFELGFYTNAKQVMQMHDDMVQEEIAQYIYEGILKVDGL